MTGVYVGELNFPSKPVTDEDIDDNAHLAMDGVKLIKYIGSSLSHEELMKGKTLSLDKGVTGEVFAAPVVNAQEGAQVAPQKSKYIYVPDVVQNNKIHYFKIPKLGAYIAIPLVYKSYLSQNTFDALLSETKKQAQERQTFQKEKAVHLQQLNADLQDLKTKLQPFIDKQDQGQIQSIGLQIKQLQTRISQQQAKQLQYTSAQTISETKQFVVCADTLGQDRQISDTQKDFFVKYIDLFRDQWQKCELDLITKDVQHQIKYQKGLRLPVKQFVEELNQQIQHIPEQQQTQLNQKYKQNQKVLNFQIQAGKLQLLKNILQKQQIVQSILKIKQFRVIKFPKLIQNLLYFLGYKKMEIDIKNTTHLNWKYVRQQLINKKFIKNIANYQFRGPKHQQFNTYEKVDSLLTAFSKFPEEQVFEYNIGLGLLLKFVLSALKLRKEDVEIRRTAVEEEKKIREEKEQENDKIEKEKEQALEKHKASLSAEQLESFNEEEWKQSYEQQHPYVQIPPEVKQDIDNDI